MRNENIADRLAYRLLQLMLLVVPFVFYTGPHSFQLPKTLVMEVLVFLVAGVMITSPVKVVSPIRRILVFFIFFYLLSISNAQNPLISIKPVLLFVTGALLAYEVSIVAAERGKLSGLCRMIILSGGVLAALSVAAYFTEPFKYVDFRVFSPAGVPAALATFIGVSMCIVWARLLVARTPRAVIMFSALMLILAAGIFFSFSKSGWAAALLGLFVTTALIFRIRMAGMRTALKRAGVLIAVIAVIAAAGLHFMSDRKTEHDLVTLDPVVVGKQIISGESRRGSFVQRSFNIKLGLKMFERNRIWGLGPGAFTFDAPLTQAELLSNQPEWKEHPNELTWRVSSHAHNEYLEIAVESGLAGAAFFVIIVISGLVLAVRGATDTTQCAVAGAFFALAAMSFFEFTLHYALTAMLFWAVLGMAAASSAGFREDPGPRRAGSVLLQVQVLTLIILFAGVVLPRPLIAVLKMQKGNIAARQGDMDKAKKLLDRASSMDPTESLIYLNAASAYNAAGDHAAALKKLNTALKISNDPALFDAAGRTFAYAGMYDSAEEAVNFLIRIDPWKTSSYINLAEIYRLSGRNEEAKNALRAALEMKSILRPTYWDHMPAAEQLLEFIERKEKEKQ